MKVFLFIQICFQVLFKKFKINSKKEECESENKIRYFFEVFKKMNILFIKSLK